MNDAFSPDRFRQAVLVQYQQSLERSERAAAQRYISSFMEREGGWQLILRSLNAFDDGRVRFVLLNALNWWLENRWSSVPPQGKKQLASLLIQWGAQNLEKNTENVNMVRPKFAQTLTLFFVHDFPHGWPSFFDELIELLPRHPSHVDMFLRVLDTIDEMVVSTEFPRTPEEIDRNTRLKDAMRAGPIGKIVTAWFNVLSSCVQNQPELVRQTLSVMRKYAPWIDIQFFTRPDFVKMIASFLASEKFQKEAAKCIAAVTGKGMPAVEKMELIRRFGLLQMCLDVRPRRGTRFAVYMARWINELGVHVLDGLAELQSKNASQGALEQARSMLDSCVQLMLSCLKELQLEASIEVIDFATRFVNYIRALPKEGVRPVDAATLQDMLQSIARLLMFPADLQLPTTLVSGETDDDCEELEEWLDERDRLAHVFRAIGRLRPQMCSSFVLSMAEAVLPRHASLPWINTELVMYLMLSLGEVLIQEGASVLKKQFRPFLALSLKSDVAGNPHFMVAKATFEVMVRFFRYIPSDEASLLLIIQVTESRGIRHSHPAVRKRAMFNFNRLAQKFGHALVPVLPRLLESLKGMLWPISPRAQDGGFFLFQMTLYETFGLLIGQNPDDSSQPAQVEAILGPVASQLRQLASAPSAAALQMTQMEMCFVATRAVEAASSFSKGFTGVVNRKNRTKDLFSSVFKTVMALRSKQLGDEELQQKCLHFMHRMVEVLQHEFLQSLESIVQMLLVEGGTTGAQDFMKLMGQLISRFGSQMQGFLGAILTPLTAKVFEYVQSGEQELARQASAGAGAAVSLSELGREVRVLRTSYYGFLQVLCKNRDLSSVLLRPDNVKVLEATLKALKQGVCWWGQPREQRDVWSILNMLLETWGAVPDNGFRSWFSREMVPILLRSPFSDSFAFDQGAHVALVRMLCQLQHACWTILGDDFKRALLATLKDVGCNEQIQQQYVALLTGSDKEPFIDFYNGMLRKWRKARIAHKQQQQQRN